MNTRDAYEQKLKAQLSEWQADVDKFRARLDKKEADAKIDYSEELEKLEQLQNEANEKYAQLKESGDETWHTVKEKTENAFNRFNEAVHSVASRF